MSPVSRGLPGIFLLLVLLQVWRGSESASVPPLEISTSPTPHKKANDIEAFVKKLEYEAQGGVDNTLDGFVDIVDFNLLPDVVADDVQAGLEEEFEAVDMDLGENSTDTSRNKTADPSRSRQLSLIYQGVYAPDARFNAFADGVMVNMVAEMKRRRMDPLYFRVYDRGIVEHVSTQSNRGGRRDEPSAVASSFTDSADGTNSGGNGGNRRGRQSGNAIGGGVIRGLTNVKRFGNAEVQVAGNTTLVRSHYVYGPLNIELVFNTDKGVKSINSTLGAVAAHAVAELHNNSSKLIDFIIDSPLFDYMPYYGNRTLAQQRTTELVVRHLFSNASFMTLLMRDAFEIASYDKIIPQFGTEANYYTVLKYLFNNNPESQTSKGISIPGVPSAIAEYLGGVARPRYQDLEVVAHPYYKDLYKNLQFAAIQMLFYPRSFLVLRMRSVIRLAAYVPSPAEYEIRLTGARSRQYQRISQSAIMRLFKPTGKLERRLKQAFIKARSRRIPDVTDRRRGGGRANGNRRGNRRNKNRENAEEEDGMGSANKEVRDSASTATEAVPELP